MPKEKALQLIDQLEQHDRLYYAGFLGNMNVKGETELFVNLRCLKVNRDSLSLFVGGGLTRGSQIDEEWLETESKAEVLGRIISKNQQEA